jgi:hypothetical protein
VVNTSQSNDEHLRRATGLIKQGQKAEAKQIISDILKSDPQNARAWYLASYLTSDDKKRIQALQRALAIDPQFAQADEALRKLLPHSDLIDDLLETPQTTTGVSRPLNKDTLLIFAIVGIVFVVLLILGLSVAPRIGLFSFPTATRTPTYTPSHIPTKTLTPTNTATPTITPSSTSTPTPTLTPTLTPTSTFTPESVNLLSIEGEATANLNASPLDYIGGGRGNFTLHGKAKLSSGNNLLKLTLIPDDGTEIPWSFQFFAPALQTSKLYENATKILFTPGDSPELAVGSTLRGCNQIGGKFIIEQQSPQLVISFTQLCENNPNMVLKGTITFTPQALLTPTPTIPPEKLFAPETTSGQFNIQLFSAAEDRIGKGKGNIVLTGPGDLRINDGTVIFTMSPVDATDENWYFGFFAPVIGVGQSYDIRTSFSDGRRQNPFMGILHGFNEANVVSCETPKGQFQVEQQAPDIVISFSELCGTSPNSMLKGKLTFTPESALTPTPTVAPDRRFSPLSSFGELSVDMDSKGRDPLGDGQGKMAFKGPAKLLIEKGGAFQFMVTRADNPNEFWQFTFYSPAPEIGKLNENVAHWPSNKHFPGMLIVTNGTNPNFPAVTNSCGRLGGSFTFEKQSPTIEISFRHLCEKNASDSLEGKLIFTLQSDLTATPTIPPEKLFTSPDTSGNFHLEFDSSPRDYVGGARGHVVLDGPGSVSISDDGVLKIQMLAPETWSFSFYAPSLHIGQLYDHAGLFQNSSPLPAMTIDSGHGSCQQPLGQFQIEQQIPIVISFMEMCSSDPNMVIKGKLTLTPLSMLTPTPTAAPGKLFKPKSSKGNVVVDLSSDQGDYIGGGKGNFTIKGAGDLRRMEEGSFTITMNVAGQGDIGGQWQFSFHAPDFVVGQTYQNATRYPFNNKQLPGIDISSPGRGCNKIIGDFKIVKASPILVMTFTQACEAGKPLLKGLLSFTPTD